MKLRKVLVWLLAAAMVSGTVTAAAAETDGAFVPQNLAEVEAPGNADDSGQLPLTGYFKSNLTNSEEFANREVLYYIPDTAVIRPYYHFIAVPNGVDASEFIVSSGWKQVADETGECLYVLLPDQETGVWGEAEAEKAYIAAARGFHGSNGKYFTTFGMFYLEGYGEGAAPLEAWAAENPHLIITQSYIGGESVGAEALAAAGEAFFGYKQMTDGDTRDRDYKEGNNNRLDADGNQKILFQMTKRLAGVVHPEAGENAGLLQKADMVVPTWIIGREADDASVAYWKQINRTGEEADAELADFGGVAVTGQEFDQKEDTWSTEYAGQISKVTVLNTEAATDEYAFTRALRDAEAIYTRYDNTISYGNGLMRRLDITPIQVERYTSEARTAVGTVSGPVHSGEEVAAEVTLKELVASDGFAFETLLYVPETAPETDIPVVSVFHGNTQTAELYFDSTCWWQTAAENGFALVFASRTLHSGSDRTHEVQVFDAIYDFLAEDGRFDMTRIYQTGQSMGSLASIEIAEAEPEKLAAMDSTNYGAPAGQEATLPAGIFVGEGNYVDRGIPGFTADTSYPEDETDKLVRSTAAAEAGADVYWDPVYLSPNGIDGSIDLWINNFAAAWGIDPVANLRSTIQYRGGNALNGGTDMEEGTLADFATNNARYRTWYWDNADGIPVMQYTFSLYEAHNDIPGFRALIWDFVKHYQVVADEDGTIHRYYSESAFAEDDKVEILK